MDLFAARVSLFSTLIVVVLILALHVVKPEMQPSWRFISEYAIGHNGWIMKVAFLAWSLGCASLFVALRGQTGSWALSAGNYLLLIVALSLVFAGLFEQDLVTIKPDEATRHGMIHAIASMVGIPGVPIAALLIGYGISANSLLAPDKTPILVFAYLALISLALMFGYLAYAVPKAGGFNPNVWAGWMNRVVVAAYLLWQLFISYRLQDRLSA